MNEPCENSSFTDDSSNGPVVIYQTASFRFNPERMYKWRKLIINSSAAALYTNRVSHEISPSNQHSIVISLASWAEMRKYNTLMLPTHVQEAKKIFLHFPIIGRSQCIHKFDSSSKHHTNACELLASFADMKAMTTLVNGYMNKETVTGILLHCNNNYDRMLLFMACCMIQAESSLDDVLDMMAELRLRSFYRRYIEIFADYLHT